MDGIWLTAVPSRLNGTDLTADEFRDNLRLRYNLVPLHMPERCNGCGEKMTVEHALSCKVGGLVHIRHDDVAEEWGRLCAKAFSPSCVTHEPYINSGERRRGGADARGQPTTPQATGDTAAAGDPAARGNTAGGRAEREGTRGDTPQNPYVAESENRGDKGCHGFWKGGRGCVFDVRLTDTECRSTRNQDPEKVLDRCEKQKKDKHLAACHERRKDFTPLVYSVDGMAGRETKLAERRLASKLAEKWGREYSEMVGFVRTKMTMSVIRANTLLVRGSRQRRRGGLPCIEDGAAMMGWHHWRERH